MDVILDSVNYKYKNGDFMVRDVSLQIQKGEIIGLLGENGAGKTTLIKLILGIKQADSGRVLLLGQDPVADPYVRTEVGVMHQSPAFEQMLSGWENLFIIGRFLGLSKEQVRVRVLELESGLGPFPYFDRPSITLSGGEKRRLQMVRALLGKPSFLILDEPTAGVDVLGRFRFYEKLKEILSIYPMTILWTTHYLEEIEQNCSRVLVMKNGSIEVDSSIRTLKERYQYGQDYLVTVSPAMSGDVLNDCLLTEACMERVGENNLRCSNVEEGVFFNSILPLLMEKGVQIQNIEKRQPTLEDIYMEITQGEKK